MWLRARAPSRARTVALRNWDLGSCGAEKLLAVELRSWALCFGTEPSEPSEASEDSVSSEPLSPSEPSGYSEQ